MAQEFKGVEQARVSVENGTPKLYINNEIVAPLIFFFNQGVTENWLERFQRPQVKLCAAAGVHIYSFDMWQPKYWVRPYDYATVDEQFRTIVEDDPEALFIPRFVPGPTPSWPEWRSFSDGELTEFADGTKSQTISLASRWFWGPADERLEALIHHVDESPYGKRILAWHLGGPNSENFQHGFRESGPDVCEANQIRFRDWLRDHYGTTEALRAAWGDEEVTLRTARVPVDEEGRFHMHGMPEIQLFYDLPRQQAWADYSQYQAELFAKRIESWARLVKRVTDGRKLTVFFYGYLFELVGSFSGHEALNQVLDCPDVDILVSPVPYGNRTAGNAAGFMSPVDSLPLHGKLWLNEDDMRTSILDEKDFPGWINDSMFGERAKTISETVNLLDRNTAALYTHRAGTWWMDLVGAGAFNDAAVWELMAERRPLFEQLGEQPRPFRPEVAVLIDERSRTYMRADWDYFYLGLMRLRDQITKCGTSAGYYTLEDFLTGLVPKCKAYLFANAFYLDDQQIAKLHQRLEQESATAIWVAAPGYLGPTGPDVNRVGQVTRMAIVQKDGVEGSVGVGLLEGLTWGQTQVFKPRLVIEDSRPWVLGTYRTDGAISAAKLDTGKWQSVFFADLLLDTTALAKVFQQAGVHLWTDPGLIVYTDSEWLVLHTGQAGLVPVYLPAGYTAEVTKGTLASQSGQTLQLDCQTGDTVWLRLHKE